VVALRLKLAIRDRFSNRLMDTENVLGVSFVL
jgi:hypothetical protein